MVGLVLHYSIGVWVSRVEGRATHGCGTPVYVVVYSIVTIKWPVPMLWVGALLSINHHALPVRHLNRVVVPSLGVLVYP